MSNIPRNSLETLLVSVLSRLGALAEPQTAKLTAKCIRNTLPIALLVSIITFFAESPLVRFVFGEPFAQAGYVTRYFLPGAIGWSAVHHINTFLTVQLGRPQIVFWISATSAAICAVTTLALVHPLGIASGAIGSSVAYLAGGAWAVAVFLRRTGLNPLELVAFNRDDLRRYLELLDGARRTVSAAGAR